MRNNNVSLAAELGGRKKCMFFSENAWWWDDIANEMWICAETLILYVFFSSALYKQAARQALSFTVYYYVDILALLHWVCDIR